jgi:hypothetical protein
VLHGIVVAGLGCLVFLVILLIVVDHRVLLNSREVDLAATSAATALDDVGGVNLREVVLLGVCGDSMSAQYSEVCTFV